MTNEQLVEEIRENGEKDLIPVLWERIKAYMFTIAGRYYNRYRQSFARCGVELADLRQECYPAYLQALNSFKLGENSAFTSFLHFPLKTAMRELLGIRTGRGNKRPLDNAMSLNLPLPGGDNEDTSFLDTIADETAEQAFEDAMKGIEDEETRQALEKALGKLTEPQREVITLYFFDSLPLKEIADRRALSIERVRQIKQKALKRLRNDPELSVYRQEQRLERRLHFGSRNYSEAFMRAQKEIKRILDAGRYLSYGREQAIIRDCIFKAQLEEHPQLEAEYKAFTLLEQLAAKREELFALAAV